MNRRISPLLLTLLFFFQGLSAALPPEENRLKEDYLPTPYTAEEIKEFCKPGYTTKYLFENPGQKPVIQTATFLESEDPEKARFSSRQESSSGELVQDDGVTEIGWKNLQAHASFPANIATLSEETFTLDGKSFECWKYEVKNLVPGQDKSTLLNVHMQLWFAKDLPGPPIKMVQSVDNKQGPSMTLILDKPCCETEAPEPSNVSSQSPG